MLLFLHSLPDVHALCALCNPWHRAAPPAGIGSFAVPLTARRVVWLRARGQQWPKAKSNLRSDYRTAPLLLSLLLWSGRGGEGRGAREPAGSRSGGRFITVDTLWQVTRTPTYIEVLRVQVLYARHASDKESARVNIHQRPSSTNDVM